MTDSAILKRYGIMTLLTMLALIAISIALSVFAGFETNGGVGIVVVIVPAMDAGTNYVSNVGALMDKARMWRLSVWFMLINLAIGLVVAAGALILSGQSVAPLFADLGLPVVLGILLAVFAIYVLVGRFALGWGARQEFRRQEKRRG